MDTKPCQDSSSCTSTIPEVDLPLSTAVLLSLGSWVSDVTDNFSRSVFHTALILIAVAISPMESSLYMDTPPPPTKRVEINLYFLKGECEGVPVLYEGAVFSSFPPTPHSIFIVCISLAPAAVAEYLSDLGCVFFH